MIRLAKILLVITIALWGLSGAFGNLTKWSETMGAVGAVISMSTFDGGAESWRATSNPALIWLGALFIILSKLAAGIMCSIGAWRMWQARSGDASSFNAAKEIALAGCAVAVIMLFGGFIVIAENWFELWRSPAFGAAVLAAAFRYGGMITLIAIFVAIRDD
jgi:predicted small integral membrane protein